MNTKNLESNTDAELVRQSMAGNPAGFEELVLRHFGAAYAVAYARLRQAEASEELTQEAFVTAYLNLKKMRDPARFAAWVCQITRGLALKWIRSGTRQSEILKKLGMEQEISRQSSSAISVSDTMQSRQESDMLNVAIEQLPVEQREVVLLHYGEELNKKEIAVRLGVHPATVGRLLNRALVHLRIELEPKLHETAKAMGPRAESIGKTGIIISTVSAMSATAKTALAGGVAIEGVKFSSLFFAARWPWVSAAIVLGTCGIIALAPTALHRVLLATRSPEMRAEIEQFRTEPVNFPAEWTATQRPSAAVTNGMRSMESEWGKVAGQVTPLLNQLAKSTEAGTAESFNSKTTRTIVVSQMKTALEITSATVHRADYFMNGDIELTAYQNLAKGAVEQAMAAVEKQQWELAFQSALLPAYMSRRNISAPLSMHGIACYMLNKSALSLAHVAKYCPDANAIKRALGEMNALYDSVILNVLDQSEILDILNQLKAYRDAGIKVSLEPGHPMFYYYKQLMNHREDFLQHKLSTLPAGSVEYNYTKTRLNQPEQMNRLLNYAGADFAYAALRINTLEMSTREKIVTARMDLARLAMAQRIKNLRGETIATTVSAFTPDYFEKEPADIFSGIVNDETSKSPYSWNAESECFYSIGPNSIDESKGLIYDPTNGTFSNGDIRIN